MDIHTVVPDSGAREWHDGKSQANVVGGSCLRMRVAATHSAPISMFRSPGFRIQAPLWPQVICMDEETCLLTTARP